MNITKTIKILVLTAIVGTIFSIPSAEALILNYEGYDHPRKNKALFVGGQKKFSYDEVTFKFDTVTGRVEYSGDITHISSGEAWKINGYWDDIDVIGRYSATVPHEDMFNTLLENGRHKITYNDIYLNITTDLDNPAYSGPTEWGGKGNPNLLIKRKRINGEYHLIVNGWLMSMNHANLGIRGAQATDQTFAISFAGSDNPDQPNAVPEPATFILMGSGLIGAALRKRKK